MNLKIATGALLKNKIFKNFWTVKELFFLILMKQRMNLLRVVNRVALKKLGRNMQ